jgi:kynurenine 3-monooxygenase
MPQNDPRKFTLIGSGLAGGLLAAYLGRAGYEVDLYERRADPSAGNFVGGRSINLALSDRGIHALEQIGIASEVMKHAIPMRGRMIHSRTGELDFQPYDQDSNKCINSIGRAALNVATINAARQYPNVRVHFNHLCTDVDLEAPAAKLLKTETNETIEVRSGMVVGVDGAFSAVRRSMQRLDRFDYSQRYLAHGYKELAIPPATDGTWRMEKNALHIWPRKSFMMIALPNPDGSFTCTLFWEFNGPCSFAAMKTDDDVRRFFNEEFLDAVAMMPTLLEDYRANPTGSLVTVRCSPWHHRDKVVLVGDAAHAVVPFYGQGMNAAFEDCVVFDDCIRAYAPDFGRAFSEYHARRKPNADALADLAVANFVEMRDKTTSRLFRWKKKLDHALAAMLPGIYLPLYGMVSFSRIPYAEAVQRSKWQDRLVMAIVLFVTASLLAMAFQLLYGGRLVQNLSVAAAIMYIVVKIVMLRTQRGKVVEAPHPPGERS